MLLAALALLAQAGLAQSNSGISIYVLDNTGEPLINHPVTIYQGRREVMRCYTDDNGDALAKPLAPNTYELRVEKDSTVRSIQNITVGVSETPSVRIDFRPGASGTVQPKGRLLVRVLDSAGRKMSYYPVGLFWKGRFVARLYTDAGGVATSFLLYPGLYEVRAAHHNSIRTGPTVRVDSGETWMSLYFNPPRHPAREQRRAIKACRRWQQRASR